MHAEANNKDEHAIKLQKKIKNVLGDKSDDRVAFLDLHDAMTVIKTHGKTQWHDRRFVAGDQQRSI